VHKSSSMAAVWEAQGALQTLQTLRQKDICNICLSYVNPSLLQTDGSDDWLVVVVQMTAHRNG